MRLFKCLRMTTQTAFPKVGCGLKACSSCGLWQEVAAPKSRSPLFRARISSTPVVPRGCTTFMP